MPLQKKYSTVDECKIVFKRHLLEIKKLKKNNYTPNLTEMETIGHIDRVYNYIRTSKKQRTIVKQWKSPS